MRSDIQNFGSKDVFERAGKEENITGVIKCFTSVYSEIGLSPKQHLGMER